jgi:hypothetical protein
MRIGVVAPLAGMLAAVLLALSPEAPSGGLATRTIDRTLLCSTSVDARGKRSVVIVVEPKIEFNPPTLSVWAIGKRNHVEPLVEVFGVGVFQRGGLYVGERACRTVRHSFAVSRVGLPGPSINRAKVEHCSAGRRVLIRVRVELSSWQGQDPGLPPIGAPEPPVLTARGNPVAASIAVRTHPAGSPIAYVLLNRGRTTLLTASPPRCGVG